MWYSVESSLRISRSTCPAILSSREYTRSSVFANTYFDVSSCVDPPQSVSWVRRLHSPFIKQGLTVAVQGCPLKKPYPQACPRQNKLLPVMELVTYHILLSLWYSIKLLMKILVNPRNLKAYFIFKGKTVLSCASSHDNTCERR
jgi:hypothetical protein